MDFQLSLSGMLPLVLHSQYHIVIDLFYFVLEPFLIIWNPWEFLLSIHKKNNKSDRENYQPDSILSILSKILERVVLCILGWKQCKTFSLNFSQFIEHHFLSITLFYWHHQKKHGCKSLYRNSHDWHPKSIEIQKNPNLKLLVCMTNLSSDLIWENGSRWWG